MTSLFIIEEQQATRHVLTRYCESMGFHVVAIATLSEAPYILATCKYPCIVLVAIHAPGLAGMGLLHLLAQGKPAYKRHQVIVIGDVPLSQLHAPSFPLDPVVFVKPLDFALLKEAIHIGTAAIAVAAGGH